VRISLLHQLIDLGYPSNLISVETALSQMVHLRGQDLPYRRIDLVVFGKGIHPKHALYPLLTIECKAERLTDAAWQQVVGYNHYLGAYFFGIAAADGVEIGAVGSADRIQGVPTYKDLIDALA